MSLTISKARQTLFTLVEAAERGEKVEFTHKGTRFYIVAEEKPSKLSRLKPMAILPKGTTIEDVDQALTDMQAENAAAWDRNNR
jgi:antitoxin (DNA-binding transcriptional repressor) of toxin-antitoxin stability system